MEATSGHIYCRLLDYGLWQNEAQNIDSTMMVFLSSSVSIKTQQQPSNPSWLESPHVQYDHHDKQYFFNTYLKNVAPP
jgi:hypothetical protein